MHIRLSHFNPPTWLEKITLKKAVITSVLGVLVWRYIRHLIERRKLDKGLETKKASIGGRIEQVEQTLTAIPESSELLSSLPDKDVKELRELLNKGELKPVELLHVFQRKALDLYKTGNSGIAEFVTDAERWAQRLEDPSGTKIHQSPLYGIPVSIKETCGIAGYDATVGLLRRCNCPLKRNGTMVKVLKRCGAVPFVLTMTSQAARALDDFNPVYGSCKNPYSNLRAPGGSSSGEGVLLASRGSPLGLGSDIGGSCRIPAAYCGLACLKPTVNRLSSKGMASIASKSVFYLQGVPGPMAKKVDDLVQFMRAVLCDDLFSLDSYVIPMKFDEAMYEGTDQPKLRIGYYRNFKSPFLPPTTTVIRNAIHQAIGALEKAGHQMIKFSVPRPEVANRLCMQAIFGDGGQELIGHLADEPLGPQLAFLKLVLASPSWAKHCFDYIARLYYGKSMVATSNLIGRKSAKDSLNLIKEIRDYVREFEQAWDKAGPLDAIICPVSCFPAPPTDADPKIVTPSVIHTLLYNLLDYPAGTVPVGFVDEVDVLEATQLSRTQALDGKFHHSKVTDIIKGSQGLPLSVQVVAKPFREELVLRVMRDIERYTQLVKPQP